MAKKQYFNIKYPFSSDGFQNFYVDANSTIKDKVRSELMHLIFTPKGQRIRMPEFGTDLIKHIFDQSDGATWEAVKQEISDSVRSWTDNISLKDIKVVKNSENESEIFVRIDYDVIDGNKVTSDSIAVQI